MANKYRNVNGRKRLTPRQRTKREEARRKRELQKECYLTVQSRKDSTTSAISGQPNDDILERISANCANCASNFENENERNVKFQTTSNTLPQTDEIEIIDAIFYIYGLTVADWSKTLTLDHASDFTTASEIVFSNGIVFCSKCTSALQNVYTSHKSLKKLWHNESLFAKTLNNKYSCCEVQNKIESDDKIEVPSLNNSDLSDKEMEFKEEDKTDFIFHPFDLQDENLEVNSEFEHLDVPLMFNGLTDLQSSNDESLSEKTSENSLIIIRNEKNVSLTDEQKLSGSGREKRVRNKNLSLNGVPQRKPCFVPTRKTLPLPKPTPDHPFSILCCDESFFSNKEFISHHLNLHIEEKPKLVKCNICEILIPSESITNHVKTYKEFRNLYFKCKICASKFKSASSMTEHLETHDPIKYTTLICDICETPMQSDFQLVVHKVRNHSESEMPESEQMYTCNICNSKIKDISSFRVHCDKHNPAKQVSCNLCGKLFPSSQNLHRHMKRLHLDILDYKYPCSNCNMMFGSEKMLAAHQARSTACHFPDRSVCEKCGKSVLYRHMKRHREHHEDLECLNKELFRCPQCGKLLKHREGLEKHRRSQHPVKEKLFFCEKCGKTTKNMSNMRIHLKVHGKD